MRRFLALVVIAGLAASVGVAQGVPDLLSYQGRVADSKGAWINGVRQLTFAIYDAEEKGKHIWGDQVFAGVTLVDGHFSVALGGSVQPILRAFNGSARYLEIRVNGVAIKPRERILTTAFAVTAAQVRGELNSFPSSGAVGIGTTQPDEVVHVVQPGAHYLKLEATAAGADVGVKLRSGSLETAVVGQDRFLLLQAERVGIGPPGFVPSYGLDVTGDVNVGGHFRVQQGQKVCEYGSAGMNAATIPAGADWTRVSCRDFAFKLKQVNSYRLICVFPAEVSQGTPGNSSTFAGYPGPDCGWGK